MTNSIYWPGTTIVRSTGNAFDLTSGARVDTHALQVTENLRAGSTRGVETRKATRGYTKGDTKSSRLRAELVSGPKTLAQLAAATGIPSTTIPGFLQNERLHGTIVMLGLQKPHRYALVRSDV